MLMGHHLIPGVSGTSGRVCKLLRRGHLRSFQPAACSGSRRAGPGSLLLPSAPWCWGSSPPQALQLTPGQASPGLRWMFNGVQKIAAHSDVFKMVIMLFGSMIPGLRPHRRGQQSPLFFADMHFAGREAEAWPGADANPNPEGAGSCCAAAPRLPLGKPKPREELEKGDRRML